VSSAGLRDIICSRVVYPVIGLGYSWPFELLSYFHPNFSYRNNVVTSFHTSEAILNKERDINSRTEAFEIPGDFEVAEAVQNDIDCNYWVCCVWYTEWRWKTRSRSKSCAQERIEVTWKHSATWENAFRLLGNRRSPKCRGPIQAGRGGRRSSLDEIGFRCRSENWKEWNIKKAYDDKAVDRTKLLNYCITSLGKSITRG
jgi:hypothetical protein